MKNKNDEILKIVNDNTELFIKIRHHLHEYPELSWKEFETSRYIKQFLDSWNIPYEKAGTNSIVATITGKPDKSKKKQKVVALQLL